MELSEARRILLDWSIEDFYIKNKRMPDPFEEHMLEESIIEDDIRDLIFKDDYNHDSQ